ncbi:hypothetical protein FEM48_Zijuj05G0168000 [Ziziphus jujuba var. spinosa]|uniref:Leucine-rich repeat-containing N-terminal plant-type domain-containing protein n=1 Tax=Ziziphus jujuba var. spinosa TaxID=714518 RepID=A0A978VFZ3_ZIZJJ|nr:hypothetical protein FEM48_Zijuj05G0168000 [Ziziphus jujuba var. spinosa]
MVMEIVVANSFTSAQSACHDDESSALMQFTDSFAIHKSASLCDPKFAVDDDGRYASLLTTMLFSVDDDVVLLLFLYGTILVIELLFANMYSSRHRISRRGSTVFQALRRLFINCQHLPSCYDDERTALLQFKESFVISKSASAYEFSYPKGPPITRHLMGSPVVQSGTKATSALLPQPSSKQSDAPACVEEIRGLQNQHPPSSCHDDERSALLQFKESFVTVHKSASLCDPKLLR